MTCLNALDALIPKIPFSFFYRISGPGHLRGPGASLGRILGGPSMEPSFWGGGLAPPPPPRPSGKPTHPGLSGMTDSLRRQHRSTGMPRPSASSIHHLPDEDWLTSPHSSGGMPGPHGGVPGGGGGGWLMLPPTDAGGCRQVPGCRPGAAQRISRAPPGYAPADVHPPK